jgi:hypothetical protein
MMKNDKDLPTTVRVEHQGVLPVHNSPTCGGLAEEVHANNPSCIKPMTMFTNSGAVEGLDFSCTPQVVV